MKLRKKPVVIDATQWFKNGDHPLDYSVDPHGPLAATIETAKREKWEGQVVRYFRRPDVDGHRACEKCGNPMHVHGWVDTLEGGHIVCPGDWIITGVKGEHYPCKPDIFAATYEPADDQPAPGLLALLKQAHAQALDPQNYPPGAATATLDEAMAMVEGKQ